MLCKGCNSQSDHEKWLPTQINVYESIISRKIFPSNSDYRAALNKNICYNLQYLEFLSECIKQLYLTSVVYTQNTKMFVIIAGSIIEGILYHEIKINNLYSRSIWRYIQKVISNERKILETDLRLETHIYQKLTDEIETEMTFDQMLSKAEAKYLLGDDHSIYSQIKIIRQLRNKIHIHVAGSSIDSDYNSFGYEQMDTAKKHC